MTPENIGVVITTYNSPAWLSKVLTGYEKQDYPLFRVIIADDGSGDETAAVVEHFKTRGQLQIDHVWHPDKGFRKCTILNKAIAKTRCDYLIFTDGDCIPAPDFVRIHRERACEGLFLSGGYIKLPMALSKKIDEAAIESGVIFDRQWLVSNGQRKSHKLWKLSPSPTFRNLMNWITPASATWNGMNSSTWTRDIIAVNGFNEDMQYGGLDREFGERLWHHGLKSRQIRYSAVCLHLDHARAYDQPEIRQRNLAIRAEVKRFRQHWTPNGLEQHIPR